MTEELSIGCSPYCESCHQLGPGYIPALARFECKQLAIQLKQQLGEPPEGCRFKVKANYHDFGTYYELNVVFNPNDEKASEYAFTCESECPDEWSEQQKLIVSREYEKYGVLCSIC